MAADLVFESSSKSSMHHNRHMIHLGILYSNTWCSSWTKVTHIFKVFLLKHHWNCRQLINTCPLIPSKTQRIVSGFNQPPFGNSRTTTTENTSVTSTITAHIYYIRYTHTPHTRTLLNHPTQIRRATMLAKTENKTTLCLACDNC